MSSIGSVEKLVEPTLIQPTFVTYLPKEFVPLAKLSPDDPTTVEVFECCINGQEIAPTSGVRRKITGFWLV
jgi:lysyl-tRNA synthetase, class II